MFIIICKTCLDKNLSVAFFCKNCYVFFEYLNEVKMKLIIFRHGETDGNVKNIVQGAGIDCPLNETGKKQAALLRDKLASEKLPAIYCSHLCRARETAEIVASSNYAPVIERDGLEEVHYGIAEGMLSAEAHVKFAAVLEAINDKSNPDRFDVSIPGRKQSAVRPNGD